MNTLINAAGPRAVRILGERMVQVDYSSSVRDQALGIRKLLNGVEKDWESRSPLFKKEDWCDPFTPPGEGTYSKTLRWIGLDQKFHTSQALSCLQNNGFEPGNAFELLALLREQPMLCFQYSLVALGQIVPWGDKQICLSAGRWGENGFVCFADAASINHFGSEVALVVRPRSFN